MNLYAMRYKFDQLMRTYGESDFEQFRDDWLNDAWERLSLMFVVPSLNRTVTFDSVADQQKYYFPYDYNGTEYMLYYDGRRLDPAPPSVLALAYENRGGNKGAVEFYAWSDIQGTEPFDTVDDCVLVNKSNEVTTANAAATHVDQWIRFDPVGAGGGAYDDPGDYGYYVSSVEAGVSLTLDREYRGPSCTTVGQVRPAEVQAFDLYGIPASDGKEIEIRYSAKPRRLYNVEDVPEWPSVSMSIVLMAVAIGHDFYHHTDLGKVWWGRAMSRVGNLKSRKENSKAELVHDLTIGSVSGRRTGLRGVWTSSKRLRR